MISRISNLIHAVAVPVQTAKSSEHRWKRWMYRWLSWTIKFGVSGAALLYIYLRVDRDTSIHSWADLSLFAGGSQWWLFLAPSLLLVGLNWGLETLKWHMLVSGHYGTHWRTSVKAVLSGTTFGVFTPNRIGEFVGRVLALQPGQRVGGTLLSLINGASQTMSTLTFGMAGLIFLLETFGLESIGMVGTRVIELLMVVSWAVFMFLYFRIHAIPDVLINVKWLKRFQHHMKALGEVDHRLLNRLFQLSILRFLTFVAQYLLVFQLLVDDPDWMQVGGAAVLTMFSTTMFSFVPVPPLIMNGAMALSYFSLFHFDAGIVTQAVLLVWLINVALPAVLGSATLFTYRIFKNA